MEEERREPTESRAEHEAGTRGGAAAFAAPVTDDILMAWAKTVVKWSPIWVGFLVALGINMVLYVLSLAIALTTAPPAVGFTAEILRTAGIWSAISSFIALFVGGFLAGRLGVQQGLRSGVMQGTVVWALFVIGSLLFSVVGFGGLISSVAGAANISSIEAAGVDVSAAEVATIISGTAVSLWWLFGGLVIAWLAAAFGGHLGVLSARPDETQTP